MKRRKNAYLLPKETADMFERVSGRSGRFSHRRDSGFELQKTFSGILIISQLCLLLMALDFKPPPGQSFKTPPKTITSPPGITQLAKLTLIEIPKMSKNHIWYVLCWTSSGKPRIIKEIFYCYRVS